MQGAKVAAEVSVFSQLPTIRANTTKNATEVIRKLQQQSAAVQEQAALGTEQEDNHSRQA